MKRRHVMGITRLAAAGVFACLAWGSTRAGEVGVNLLVNPSFEGGEEGTAPTGWSGKSYELPREPYGADASKTRANDKLCFVKGAGGREDGGGMGILIVKGEDKWSMGYQEVEARLDAPTRFTFSVYVRSDGSVPAGDPSAYVSVRGLKWDEATGSWKKQATVGGGGQSQDFTPTSEWTKVAVSSVYPPGIERVRAVIGLYSRDVEIEVDDAHLARALAVPEFNVEGEAKDLSQLAEGAGRDDEKAAALRSLLEAIREKLATAGSAEATEEAKVEAARTLPSLIQEYFARKEELKRRLLESLFE
ncbi:MAG: hypothetical protein V2A58_07020 [Planctomycetota bacterium]